LCKSIKWDIIRTKRVEMLRVKQELEDRNKRVDKWAHLALFYLNVKRARKKTNVRVLEIIKRMKIVYMINMMKMKVKRKMIRIRPTLLLRNKQDLRNTLNATVPTLYKAGIREQASEKINDFMYYISFRLKTEETVEKIKYFQRAWRSHNLSLHNRLEYLKNDVWSE